MMKKIVALLLVACFVLSTCTVAFAKDSFDKSKIESSPLYNYDKFKNSWTLTGVYDCWDFMDDYNRLICVTLGFSDSSIENGFGPTFMFEAYEEPAGYLTIDSFYAIVDEKTFAFENLATYQTASGFGGCSVSKAFCDALTTAKEVAFQFCYKNSNGVRGTATVESVSLSAIADLITVAQLLKSSNAWSVVTNLSSNDSLFKASMY